MPARRRLAEPGRTGEQQVVDGLAALLGARSSMISRCSCRRGWPTNSSRRRGRSVVSSAASTGSAAGLQQLFSHAVAHAGQRAAGARRASRSSTVAVRRRAGRARRAPRRRRSRGRRARRAPRRARSATRPPVASARSRSGTVEAGLQLDEQPLRGALADPGHEHERVEVVVERGTRRSARRRVHRQDRERELRARRRSRRSAPRTCRARRASGTRRASSRPRARAGA